MNSSIERESKRKLETWRLGGKGAPQSANAAGRRRKVRSDKGEARDHYRVRRIDGDGNPEEPKKRYGKRWEINARMVSLACDRFFREREMEGRLHV